MDQSIPPMNPTLPPKVPFLQRFEAPLLQRFQMPKRKRSESLLRSDSPWRTFEKGSWNLGKATSAIVDELDIWTGVTVLERQGVLQGLLEELSSKPPEKAIEQPSNSKRERDEVEDLIERLSRADGDDVSGGEDQPVRSRIRIREEDTPWHKLETPVDQRPECVQFAKSTPTTSQGHEHLLPPLQSSLVSSTASLVASGKESCEGDPSTLTRSSRQCMVSSLLRRERIAWATLSSFYKLQRPSEPSKPPATGPQPSGALPKPSRSLFPIVKRNWPTTRNISSSFSPPKLSPVTPESCSMTRQLELASGVVKTHYSPTSCLSQTL